AVADEDVAVAQLRAPGADRLDFPALERDPGLVALFDEIIMDSLAVLDDRHGPHSHMKRITRSALGRHGAEEVYALVDAIEAYPGFLPWCLAAQVQERTGESTRATLTVGVR